MNINQSQLTQIEQNLITKVLDFPFKVGNTTICLNSISSQVKLELSNANAYNNEHFDITILNNYKKSLEAELHELSSLMLNYYEKDPEYRNINETSMNIQSLLGSIEDAIKLDGIVRTPRLGAFWGNKQLNYVINLGTCIDLYINNIEDAANNYGSSREYVLITTFIHEMFHAWNFFACGKKERTVREIDEAMVEFATLYFLYQISITHNEFEPILNWAEQSISLKQKIFGETAAYGYGYYLYSIAIIAKSKKAIKMLQYYPFKSGHIRIEAESVKQVVKQMMPIYPHGQEREVCNLFYTIICPEIIAQIWERDGIFDITKEGRGTNLSGIYMNNDLLQIVNSKEAYRIEFKYNKTWYPLYDDVLFDSVTVFSDFLYARVQSNQINTILHLRHIKKNLSVCKNDILAFKEIIKENTLKTDQDIFNKFVRVEKSGKYNYFSYKHDRTSDLYFDESFDACAKPLNKSGWVFPVILRNRCLIFDDKRQDVSQSYSVKDLLMKWKEALFNKINIGEPASSYNWGEAYQEGKFVIKNIDRAIEWYIKAAELGHLESQYRLGEIYYDGQEVNKNENEAIKWFKMAADQGKAEAQYYLAVIYREKADDMFNTFIDTAERIKDTKKKEHLYELAKNGNQTCIDWCQRLDKQKEVEGQYNLGEQYRTGWKVFKNERTAIELFYKAAINGYCKAIDSLEQLQDEESGEASFCLGEIYHNGDGVKQDDKAAMDWYRKAANKGNTKAKRKLK